MRQYELPDGAIEGEDVSIEPYCHEDLCALAVEAVPRGDDHVSRLLQVVLEDSLEVGGLLLVDQEHG